MQNEVGEVQKNAFLPEPDEIEETGINSRLKYGRGFMEREN